MLYTDGIEDGVFPPDLLIGRVVEQVPGELFDSAIVDPQVDFSKLSSVFVIRMSGASDDEEDAEKVPSAADGTEVSLSQP